MRRTLCLSGLVALAVLCARTPARSAPSLDFRPNFNAISVYLTGAAPETAVLEYRVKGGPDWLRANDLVKNAAGMTCGSIIYLRAGTRYQVRAEVGDCWITRDVMTRRDAFPAGGRLLPVHTEQQLQQAVKAARPGDTVLVSPGTYRMPLLVSAKSGRPDAYVHIRSKLPGAAILDGTDPRFEAGRGGWRSEGEGV